MEVYQGKSVFGGIAIGRISVHKKDEQQVKRVKIENPDLEIARYRQARQTAMEQLRNLYQKALKEVGEANAAIFEIHQMMLEDDDYNESIENIIHMQQVNAEYAVASTGDNFAQMFASMEDDYMRARSADVKDISERVLSVLGGRTAGMAASEEPVIIVADDLAPSETVQLNKDAVAAEDLDALADLVNYPVYVALGDGSVIETREDLIALGADKIFTPELKDSMANADLSELSPSMAGFTLYSTGDGPNITFNVQNGVLGISGINY